MAIVDYLANHYVLFIILTILMLFALAGYFAKKKSKESQAYKIADNNTKAEEELENLAQKVNKGASIQDFMKQNVSVSAQEEQQVQNTVNQTQSTEQLFTEAPILENNNNQVPTEMQQQEIENLDSDNLNIQI